MWVYFCFYKIQIWMLALKVCDEGKSLSNEKNQQMQRSLLKERSWGWNHSYCGTINGWYTQSYMHGSTDLYPQYGIDFNQYMCTYIFREIYKYVYAHT